MSQGTSIDEREVARFAALAEEWWDPAGKFKPLHKFNPARLAYIRERLGVHVGARTADLRPFEGLRLLDVGCGGGLVSEPMARLGAEVTGIDAVPRNIETARRHADDMGLAIDYRVATAETLARAGAQFDAILSLEVVEHVADVQAFLDALGTMLRPSGAMILGTLNRTAKAFLLAILGAEYVLGWLPRGTHDWRRFLRPDELERKLVHAGLSVGDRRGVVYNPLTDGWSLSRDLAVNYLLFAVKERRRPAS